MAQSRRDFVANVLGAGAAAFVPARLLSDPYHPLPRGATAAAGAIRVRGRVVAEGRPVRGARVSDGRAVVAVDRDGRFDFVTSETQRYLSVCPPPGHAVPTNAHGAFQLFRPIAAAPEQSHEFLLTPSALPDEQHAFLVLADPQTENALEMGRFHAETVPDVAATVKALGRVPSFGVGCGDLMFDDLSLFPEYERAIRGMGIPFAQVVGNHDLDQTARTTEAATTTYRRHFGPEYFSFDMGSVHYLILHDVFWHGAGYIGYLPEEQLAWVRNDLAHVERGRTIVVFLHIPVVSTQWEREGSGAPGLGTSITNREALYRALDGYRAHIIAGHTHETEHRMSGGVHEHVCGAVCGAWWSGDICHDGAPNGYAVYEVRGDRLQWRYQCTGRGAAHQQRLYAPGAEASAPGDVVANVWDWDPTWTVTWFEDGQPRGLMSRRRGRDPLSVQQHLGPRLPERRTWVEPLVTNHMFYAATSPQAKEWRVEARDGFGRTYTETLRRG